MTKEKYMFMLNSFYDSQESNKVRCDAIYTFLDQIMVEHYGEYKEVLPREVGRMEKAIDYYLYGLMFFNRNQHLFD